LAAGMALALVPAAGALTDSAATTTKVIVRPATGGPHTRFKFSFRSPNTIGIGGDWSRVDTLSVAVAKRPGCISDRVVILPRSQAGTMVRVTLNPSRLGGSWCIGTFRGEIVERQRILCSPLPVDLCPQVIIAPQVIARFKFRVTTTA
jgi:hypothetical protein